MSGYLMDLLVPRVREAALKILTRVTEKRETYEGKEKREESGEQGIFVSTS